MKREEHKPILIVGFGNPSIREESIGIEVVKKIRQHVWPKHVQFEINNKTNDLPLEVFYDHEFVIFIISAHTNHPIGNVRGFKEVQGRPYYWTKCSFDIALKRLLEKIHARNEETMIDLVLISIGGEDEKVRPGNEFWKANLKEIEDSVADLVFDYLASPRETSVG
ncbi:MAG: hypothetical protein KDC49_10380 [Saprospiraceae bacterium]|nr:hypothetical protein [Saprospiraceae bacterium]